ncbi:TetR/AcrR family transcriptional regulator [Hoyosella sp. YIM 151337]|uniref:TetR/AcrR family transcriptional regulator n=1 Tax=Hoyosella sp. YIM 151337 TaxID=2992742 RepID=UPI002236586B|nr:TetR/AcrR family transcriptional regulator [Hoyosella sp. YIM 151337]MCW4355917.1 TetR/AcrR family transcriptional regulator [Hoyosella sp. YIM 151337]
MPSPAGATSVPEQSRGGLMARRPTMIHASTSLKRMVEAEWSPNRYQRTALSLMRSGLLDALGEQLRIKKWSAVTMADIAAAAGVSRKTLYNEFQSRSGLARAYAARLTGEIADAIAREIQARSGDPYGAIHAAYSDFFDRIEADPLVASLRGPDAPIDLLRMITVDSQFLVDDASPVIAEAFQHSWVGASERDANVLGEAMTRTALNFVALPPKDREEAISGVASIYAPYIEAISA